jgi:hypothetical protein
MWQGESVPQTHAVSMSANLDDVPDWIQPHLIPKDSQSYYAPKILSIFLLTCLKIDHETDANFNQKAICRRA